MHHQGDGTTGKVTGSSFNESDPALQAALMLDQMAHRYHMLPSELLARGTTQDIYVFDVSTSYQLYIQKKQNKAAGISQSDPATQPAPPELAERLALFKERTRK